MIRRRHSIHQQVTAQGGERPRLSKLAQATSLGRWLLLFCTICYAMGARPAQAAAGATTMLPATASLPTSFTATHPATTHAAPAGHAGLPTQHPAALALPPLPPLPAPAPHRPVRPRGPIPAIIPLRPTAGSRQATLSVQPGWNLITLPLAPTSPISASTVLATLLGATHGTLAALYGLTRSAWSPSLIDQSNRLTGTDFTLTLGQGYLLYSDLQGSFALTGTPAAAPSWTLSTGWNLIGLPAGATTPVSATTVLQSVLATSHGHLSALYGLSHNAWSPSLIAVGSGTIGQDFALQAGTGYLAYSDSAAPSVAVPGFLPPDPSSVAPPLDPSVPTTVLSSTAFLYTGPNPIQTGVPAGTIVLTRAAVLRGEVEDSQGNPLPGVTVTVLEHPEYGQTLSRADGMFDLAVNGGGLLVVQYAKQGYITAQRQVVSAVQDYTIVPTATLLQYDPNVTAISLSSTAPLQVAQGSTESDDRGSRQATLLFPSGTTATMTLPDGTTQPLSTIHVRATEFTVGPNGPAAMPGDLPANSGYTYAADFSVDEAVAAGATAVSFSQPVPVYLQNFLDFAVGQEVPSGYYDAGQGKWIAAKDGRVVQILRISNGQAVLDVDGNGQPATDAELAALGITTAELQELATLYPTGQTTLWRVPIVHFSRWDFNWPFGPPPGAKPPATNLGGALGPNGHCDCQDQAHGSIIGTQNQTLGENISLTGTPFFLHYQSDRTAAQPARTLPIPLSGATLPPSVQQIQLQVIVAGVEFDKSFSPAPNLSYLYQWNGLNAYGQQVRGPQPVTVRVGYTYNGVYLKPSENPLDTDPNYDALFGHFSYYGAPATAGGASPSRPATAGSVSRFMPAAGAGASLPITLWEVWQGTLSASGSWDARGVGLGGWSLSVQHSYDPVAHVLYMGDGEQRSVQSVPQTISTVAGGGIGDGGPATGALVGPEAVAVGPDGSIYIADESNDRVRRVAPDGTISTVAGNGIQGESGDGGAATDARLQPVALAFGPDGDLYIADAYSPPFSSSERIRRVDANGIITTVAGGGSGCPAQTDSYGDGCPATRAQIVPTGIAFGPDGSLYIADQAHQFPGGAIIRKVALNGIISTVAGNGQGCANATSPCGDGGPATQAQLGELGDPYIQVGKDGSLYIADTGDYRIRKVMLNGIITTIAGDGQPCSGGPCGDGGPATQAQLSLGSYTGTGLALGSDGSLYIADGGDNRIRKVAPDGTISTVAGTGYPAFSGDGGQATKADLDLPAGVALGQDGSLYIADFDNGRIRRVDTGGTISTVAGHLYVAPIGDGGPATQASFDEVAAVAVAPDDSLYVVDGNSVDQYGRVINDDVVRRVEPDGIIRPIPLCLQGDATCSFKFANARAIALAPDGSFYLAVPYEVYHVAPDGTATPFAGGGHPQSGVGDGLAATQAALSEYMYGLAVASDGSVYISDPDHARVRRVGPDGIITTVAGGGSGCAAETDNLGDGCPAAQATLGSNDLGGVAVTPDGSLYIADRGNGRVRRVGPDGIISTVAGGGALPVSFGGPATQVQLDPLALAAGPDGSLYIGDMEGQDAIRRLGPEGTITTVAGGGPLPMSSDGLGDNGPATDSVVVPYGLAVGPDGSLYVADSGSLGNRIRRITPAMPGLTPNGYLIPSDDGSQIYVFDYSGRHLRTLDALTNTPIYTFAYNSAGRLSGVTDRAGNVTTIQRDASGNPVAIVSPYGQRTALSLDGNGYLATVADPAGDTTSMTYSANGLMASFSDPDHNTNHFTYDTNGRLVADQEPNLGTTTLSRIDDTVNYTTTVTTAMSRTSIYGVQNLADGSQIRTTIDPAGLKTITQVDADSSTTETDPDGTMTTAAPAPDPRFGMLASTAGTITVKTPKGLTSTITTSGAAQLSNPADPLSLLRLTTTTNDNGNTFTSTYLAATRTITDTTPAGRTEATTLDTEGRVIQDQVAGLLPIHYSYDGRGRLSSMTQGSRVTTYTYDANGNLASVTDPLQQVTSYTYDAADRVTQEKLPDGSAIAFGYDADGNLTSLAPPGQPAHTFTYDQLGDMASYNPPALGSATTPTTYSYNQDGQLTVINQPSGSAISLSYDSAGRLSGFSIPRGQTSYAYDPHSGNLSGITAPDGGTLAFQYDGFLLTGSAATDGAVGGTIGYSYDNNLRLSTETLNGAAPIAYGYDADSLLTNAGALNLTYSAANGLYIGSTLGSVADSLAYSGFGEVNGYQAMSGATTLLSESYTRDALGRITQRTETIGGTTHTYAYSYDLDGRVTGVTIDGKAATSYTYDANGNRLSATGVISTTGTLHGTYDAQDRLTQYDSVTYSYNAAGDLVSKNDTSGNKTTTYSYDALGNLLGVTLPDQTKITYLIDGENRRIGKEVNGTLVQGFIYDENALGPVAETDGTGNVTAQFAYAGDPSVPAYMIKGGVTYRIIADWLGSPRLVVNASTGAIAERIDYDEFGNVLKDSNPGFQPFGFAGGLYDTQTGLLRFGARDYDPAIGRWTAKDPIGFAGGDSDLYSYTANDPINSFDPLGLQYSADSNVVNQAQQAAGGYLNNVQNGLHNLNPNMPKAPNPDTSTVTGRGYGNGPFNGHLPPAPPGFHYEYQQRNVQVPDGYTIVRLPCGKLGKKPKYKTVVRTVAVLVPNPPTRQSR